MYHLLFDNDCNTHVFESEQELYDYASNNGHFDGIKQDDIGIHIEDTIAESKDLEGYENLVWHCNKPDHLFARCVHCDKLCSNIFCSDYCLEQEQYDLEEQIKEQELNIYLDNLTRGC